MKDKLGRDIMLGDTLAHLAIRHSPSPNGLYELALAKVTGVANFALQLTPTATGDKAAEPCVISKADDFVICDWAKGSDAAK